MHEREVTSLSAVPAGNVYDKYGTSNALERRLVEGFLTALDAALPSQQPRRILEIGMGEGVISARVAGRFSDAEVVGLDLPDATLAAEWDRRGLLGVFADAAHLPFPDRSMDLVLAIEVLEHVQDPEVVLTEIARVASRFVVLSVPSEPLWRLGNMARGRYWRQWGNTPGHIQHWSTRSFVQTVRNRLEVIAVRRPLPWTMVVAHPRSVDVTNGHPRD